MTIIEHTEEYLGRIDKGWKDNGSDESLQIVSFEDVPCETVSTFISLGMSNYILDLNERKKVRQELVFSLYTVETSKVIVSLLMSLCEAVVGRGKGVLRGEAIPLPVEFATRIGFEAIYCTIPMYFDDDFCTYYGSTPPTVIVWVIPIYQSEADYIKVRGWEQFEDLLEERDPDLCSLERSAIV